MTLSLSLSTYLLLRFLELSLGFVVVADLLFEFADKVLLLPQRNVCFLLNRAELLGEEIKARLEVFLLPLDVLAPVEGLSLFDEQLLSLRSDFRVLFVDLGELLLHRRHLALERRALILLLLVTLGPRDLLLLQLVDLLSHRSPARAKGVDSLRSILSRLLELSARVGEITANIGQLLDQPLLPRFVGLDLLVVPSLGLGPSLLLLLEELLKLLACEHDLLHLSLEIVKLFPCRAHLPIQVAGLGQDLPLLRLEGCYPLAVELDLRAQALCLGDVGLESDSEISL